MIFILPGVILSILVAVFVALGAYFFSLAHITVKMFLTINAFPLINSILTMNFLLFLICAAVSIAMMLVIGRRYSFTGALALTIIPYFVGAAIGTFFFGLNEFFIPIAGIIIGLPVGIKFLAEKEDELRYLKRPRAGGSAAGRIITIASLIFALFLLLQTLPQKEALREEFVPELLMMTIGDKDLTMGDSFRLQLAESIAAQQVSTIDLMLNQTPLKNLSAKNDQDAQDLISSLNATKLNFEGDAFKKDVADKLQSQDLDLGKELLNKFPMIELVSRFAWLMYPFTALVTLMFIGGLITRNLAALFYGVLEIYIRPVGEKAPSSSSNKIEFTVEEKPAQTAPAVNEPETPASEAKTQNEAQTEQNNNK